MNHGCLRVLFVCAPLALASVACGGGSICEDCINQGGGGSTSSSSSTSSSDSSGAGAGPAVGEVITLEVEPFDVNPGTERQVCKTVNLPKDSPAAIVRFHSSMLGTSHHFNAYKVLGNATPVSQDESTVHDCSPAAEQLSGDAAYIFGAATPERTMETPAGVAFLLEPGQRIILEQHVINAGSSVIQGGIKFELGEAADPATIEHHADIAWLGNWGFLLSPNAETKDTVHCAFPYAVEVFGLMSHTHALGSHFSIEKWTPSGTTHVYDSTDWSHPPYKQFDPRLTLEAGEGLEWTCTWKNTTSGYVVPGKESTDEMCITFAAVYPRDTLDATPYQCNDKTF